MMTTELPQVQIYENTACTACGCVCDDIRVTISDNRVIETAHTCEIGKEWFLSQTHTNPAVAAFEGKEVLLETAIARASELLKNAKYPVIYGLSRSTTEGQRAAVHLAEQIRATIDTSAATGHAPSLMALQEVGESTCTLGEVKQRADLIVFWGCDPVTTHPRHLERYCPPRAGRKIITVDVAETPTAKVSDHYFSVSEGNDWQLLTELRALRKQPNWEGASITARHLHKLFHGSRFGIVFFGGGLVKQPFAHRTVEVLLRYTMELNDQRRFYARRLRRMGDVAGADSVLTWQTGFPFGVNFASGSPRYNPGEFTVPEMLARREPDLCLLIGSETIRDFSSAALSHLRNIPTITLDSPGTQSPVPPTIRFHTAVYGIHKQGTAYRMDEVPIPLRKIADSAYPSDYNVLRRILEYLQK
ncbi:MAG: formylmethanofuran dehydrogenase subunit B [Zavarzinella sp.]